MAGKKSRRTTIDSVHAMFNLVSGKTMRCDFCNARNTGVLKECRDCQLHICYPCAYQGRLDSDRRHRLSLDAADDGDVDGGVREVDPAPTDPGRLVETQARGTPQPEPSVDTGRLSSTSTNLHAPILYNSGSSPTGGQQSVPFIPLERNYDTPGAVFAGNDGANWVPYYNQYQQGPAVALGYPDGVTYGFPPNHQYGAFAQGNAPNLQYGAYAQGSAPRQQYGAYAYEGAPRYHGVPQQDAVQAFGQHSQMPLQHVQGAAGLYHHPGFNGHTLGAAGAMAPAQHPAQYGLPPRHDYIEGFQQAAQMPPLQGAQAAYVTGQEYHVLMAARAQEVARTEALLRLQHQPGYHPAARDLYPPAQQPGPFYQHTAPVHPDDALHEVADPRQHRPQGNDANASSRDDATESPQMPEEAANQNRISSNREQQINALRKARKRASRENAARRRQSRGAAAAAATTATATTAAAKQEEHPRVVANNQEEDDTIQDTHLFRTPEGEDATTTSDDPQARPPSTATTQPQPQPNPHHHPTADHPSPTAGGLDPGTRNCFSPARRATIPILGSESVREALSSNADLARVRRQEGELAALDMAGGANVLVGASQRARAGAAGGGLRIVDGRTGLSEVRANELEIERRRENVLAGRRRGGDVVLGKGKGKGVGEKKRQKRE